MAAIKNKMDGIGHTPIDPLTRMRMVLSSGIFGEKQYYKGGRKPLRRQYANSQYTLFDELYSKAKTTADVAEEAIDQALSYDFFGALNEAVSLRIFYRMRLNPQIIAVRAAMHPARKEFTAKREHLFRDLLAEIVQRPDDISAQLLYYMEITGGKKQYPNCLRRAQAERFREFNEYQLGKYAADSEMPLWDVVNIIHPRPTPAISALMKGELHAPDGWRVWRSAGKTWAQIFTDGGIDALSHQDMLKQMRAIFKEIDDVRVYRAFAEKFSRTVEAGRLFPHNYYAAYQAVKVEPGMNFKEQLLGLLEVAVQLSLANLPKLPGNVMCLSDNSGSAWGALTVEGASTHVAEIDNLSSIVTASLATGNGEVGYFGDRLVRRKIDKKVGPMAQMPAMKDIQREVGLATEHGVWLFWKQATEKREHWDTVFIYSDQQAGHGGLYGTERTYPIFHQRGEGAYDRLHRMDVWAMVETYRAKVNPLVNVFSVQTAGYDNAVLPEYVERGAMLYGWTGMEGLFASRMAALWNNVDNDNEE